MFNFNCIWVILNPVNSKTLQIILVIFILNERTNYKPTTMLAKRKRKKRSGLQKLEISMAILMATITLLGIAVQIFAYLNQ